VLVQTMQCFKLMESVRRIRDKKLLIDTLATSLVDLSACIIDHQCVNEFTSATIFFEVYRCQVVTNFGSGFINTKFDLFHSVLPLVSVVDATFFTNEVQLKLVCKRDRFVEQTDHMVWKETGFELMLD
jgi:hypothetical protein